ncbi:MAG: RnfABCDGE type electron transport complex subunit D [Halothiobacillaceae bacterium]
MHFEIHSSPHVQSTSTVAQVMRAVLYALIPGTLVAIALMGWGVLVNVLLAVASALVFEAVMLSIRRRPVGFYLRDGSVVVLAWILALCLPTLVPWWIPVFAAGFAVVVGKQLFGGLGYNLFNPAMVGYVVVLVSFPAQMTLWGTPAGGEGLRLGFLETWQWSLFGTMPPGLALDAITQATPLDAWRTEQSLGVTGISALQDHPAFGILAGQGSEWVALAFLAGGVWMIWRRIIRWHIPVAMLGSLTLVSTVFWLVDPEAFGSPAFHLLAGGTMLGAFFVATDPVSAATTDLGRLVYGAGIGVLIYVIRSFGVYVDGVAFAVLLMNAAVPLIDYYTQPRPFGHKKTRASSASGKGGA